MSEPTPDPEHAIVNTVNRPEIIPEALGYVIKRNEGRILELLGLPKGTIKYRNGCAYINGKMAVDSGALDELEDMAIARAIVQ